MDDGLLKYVPRELLGEYEPVRALKELPDRQTVLLRGRDGTSAVLKRAADGSLDAGIYEAVRGLDGQGVPRIMGIYRDGDVCCVLREYVEGSTLLELYRSRGSLSADETAKLGAQIAETLERLHEMEPPIIHRDIKAENVVLTPNRGCVLIDFGIARRFSESDTRDTRIIGTGFAAAPEQFGYSQTDPRSDIYSLGVLLHEISTGEYSLDRGRVPAELGRVVAKCTRFDPKDRYQSAKEVKRALLRVRRRPKILISVIAAALVTAAVLAIALIGGIPDESRIYSFASPLIGREVARQLGKDVRAVTRGDLDKITSIQIAGTYPFDGWERILIHGKEFSLDGQYFDTMAGGTVDTLEDIPNFKNLTELSLCNQEITDLSPLSGTKIENLALHGNKIENLTPLGGCPELRELYISDNPVSDISPLKELTKLSRLNIGATLVTSLDALADFPALTSLELHDCPELSMDGVERLSRVDFLSVRPVSAETLAAIGGMTRLCSLYAWSGEELEDLSAISGLTDLTNLYIDFSNLKSIDGIQGMRSLTVLDIRGGLRLDAGPIAALTELKNVNLFSLYSDDWSELCDLKNLQFITARFEDSEAIQKALDGRSCSVSYLPS